MLFYFTATGNSLYAARQLDSELISIAQELNKPERSYEAQAIGVVCPLYEFDMPRPVKEFIKNSRFTTDYFYVVVTYGMHSGGVAERVAAELEAAGRHVDYFNTVAMHDNALIVFDMNQQRSVEPEKMVDEHLAALRTDIDARTHHVQPTTQIEADFYEGYMAHPLALSPTNEKPLYRVTESCIGCGTCAQVCPLGCIRMDGKRPAYDFDKCVSCMACIQACPKLAIQFANFKEPNPNARYRNPHVSLADIVTANRQA